MANAFWLWPRSKKVSKHAFRWRYFLLHFFPWRQPRVCRTPALIERSEITRRLVWALNCISWWPKGVLQYLILIKTSAAFCHNWACVFGFRMLRKPPLISDDCAEVALIGIADYNVEADQIWSWQSRNFQNIS